MLCLPKPELVSVNIPFSGFYESQWSYLLAREDESYLEYAAENENNSPEERLCAKHGDLSDILWKHTDYRLREDMLAEDYASAYFWWLAESLGFPVTRTPFTWGYGEATYTSYTLHHPVAWEFEEVDRPRYYNFSTDRIFAKVDAVLIRELYRQVMLVDNSWAYEGSVKAMFTSYDGFSSFYDNDPEALKEKPLEDWDHNELKALLVAWARIQLGPDGRVEDELYEGIADNSYRYFDAGTDWGGLEEACREQAREYLENEELTEAERYRLEHPRCPDTLELPL